MKCAQANLYTFKKDIFSKRVVYGFACSHLWLTANSSLNIFGFLFFFDRVEFIIIDDQIFPNPKAKF